MLGFITRRLFSGVLLLFVITSLAYFLVFFTVDGVAYRLLGDAATEADIIAKNQELGLDRPFFARYFDWLAAAVQGDFGTSWFNSEKIIDALANRLPVTITVVGIAIMISAILAVVLGMAAAIKGGWIDRMVQLLAITGFAIPGFVIAVVAVTIFAITFPLLPATGWVPISEDPVGWLLSLILPTSALVIATVASSAQQIRSAIKSVYERDWVRTLRSRGIAEKEILFKHVLRAAAPSGLTVLSLQFVGMLGGSVIIESIFALPGLGQYAVSATGAGDTPVVMGIVVFTVIVVIVVNLLVDLINGWLNPKVRVK
jgi:peptide/nickel transport system permease protein